MLRESKTHIEKQKFDAFKQRLKNLKPIQATQNDVETVLGQSLQGETSLEKGENTQNSFGLSEVEKSSIEADINAGKPISATLAYQAFLLKILGTPRTGSIFTFSSDTPEYEIHSGNIRTNHQGALAIVNALSKLFGKTVRLPTKGEAIAKMAQYNHLAGCRDASYGKSWGIGEFGFAWLDGSVGGEYAPYAGHFRDGNSFSVMRYHHRGCSVIPCFG